MYTKPFFSRILDTADLPDPDGPIIKITKSVELHGIVSVMLFINRYAITYWGLLRYQTWLLLILFMITGLGYTLSLSLQSFNVFASNNCIQLVIAGVMMGLWYMNGTGLNDYADYEIDIINLRKAKDRPLVAGHVSKNELLVLSLVSGFVCFGLSTLLNTKIAVLTAVLLALNTAYSIKPVILSRRGGLAPLLLPLGYVVYPVLIAHYLSSPTFNTKTLFLIAALYVQFLSRIILKDYRDIVGDKAAGKITFLLKHGNKLVTQVSQFNLVLFAIITAALLYKNIVAVVLISFISSVAYGFLSDLAKTNNWLKQKPIIVSFGRLSSGATVLVLLAFLYSSSSMPYSAYLFFSASTCVLFAWSAYDTRMATKI